MLIFQENTFYSSYNLNTKRDNLLQDQQHSQTLVLQQCPPAVNSDIFTQGSIQEMRLGQNQIPISFSCTILLQRNHTEKGTTRSHTQKVQKQAKLIGGGKIEDQQVVYHGWQDFTVVTMLSLVLYGLLYGYTNVCLADGNSLSSSLWIMCTFY